MLHRPWEVVAQVAADVHGLGIPPREVLRTQTCTEHRNAALQIFEGLTLAPIELQDARSWMMEHVSTERSPALLHGDLLGHNILLDPSEDAVRLGLVDWEHSFVGDPAYDLAIVTRGVRRPFQVHGGLDHLLESYNCRASVPLSPSDVRFFELSLLIGFYRDASSRGPRHPQPPDQLLPSIVRLLRQAGCARR
jgi:hypothetical protein